MKIEKPTEITYFICRDENQKITAYGEVGIENVMETNQPIVNTYLEKTEWQKILKENGIDTENEK
jgi:hypothetical protein